MSDMYESFYFPGESQLTVPVQKSNMFQPVPRQHGLYRAASCYRCATTGGTLSKWITEEELEIYVVDSMYDDEYHRKLKNGHAVMLPLPILLGRHNDL
jgi:hypothetical protein